MSVAGLRRGPREVAGRLDQFVLLSGPVRTPDGQGGRVTEYVPLQPSRVSAAVEAIRGTERLQAAGLDLEVSHRVLMRWHAQVTAATRITWGARVLEVVGVPAEIGRRDLLECLCAERLTETET